MSSASCRRAPTLTPSSRARRTSAKVADADLVLSVGLGLEASWLHDLLENAARDESAIVELGEIVDPIEFAQGHAGEVEMLEDLSHIVHEVEEGEIDPETGLDEIKELLEAAESEEEELPAMLLEIVAKVDDGQMDAQDAIEEVEHLTSEGEDEHAGHRHGLEDPHFWFDPLRVKLAVNDISARLSVLDPDRGDTYSANASAYNARLDELHAWSEQQAATVPEDRRAARDFPTTASGTLRTCTDSRSWVSFYRVPLT